MDRHGHHWQDIDARIGIGRNNYLEQRCALCGLVRRIRYDFHPIEINYRSHTYKIAEQGWQFDVDASIPCKGA